MKRFAFTVGLVVLAFGVAIIAQTQTASVEKKLIKLENAWNDALVKNDWVFIDQFLADDYIHTDNDGVVETKAQDMASLKSGEYVALSLVNDDFRVRVYGDAAVVTLRIAEKSKSKGKEISQQIRVTDTLIKIAGRWQVVAEHTSKIPQK